MVKKLTFTEDKLTVGQTLCRYNKKKKLGFLYKVKVKVVTKSKSLWMVTAAMQTPAPWKESYDQPRQHVRKLRHYFANIGWFSQSYGFFSSHV